LDPNHPRFNFLKSPLKKSFRRFTGRVFKLIETSMSFPRLQLQLTLESTLNDAIRYDEQVQQPHEVWVFSENWFPACCLNVKYQFAEATLQHSRKKSKESLWDFKFELSEELTLSYQLVTDPIDIVCIQVFCIQKDIFHTLVAPGLFRSFLGSFSKKLSFLGCCCCLFLN